MEIIFAFRYERLTRSDIVWKYDLEPEPYWGMTIVKRGKSACANARMLRGVKCGAEVVFLPDCAACLSGFACKPT